MLFLYLDGSAFVATLENPVWEPQRWRQPAISTAPCVTHTFDSHRTYPPAAGMPRLFFGCPGQVGQHSCILSGEGVHRRDHDSHGAREVCNRHTDTPSSSGWRGGSSGQEWAHSSRYRCPLHGGECYVFVGWSTDGLPVVCPSYPGGFVCWYGVHVMGLSRIRQVDCACVLTVCGGTTAVRLLLLRPTPEDVLPPPPCSCRRRLFILFVVMYVVTRFFPRARACRVRVRCAVPPPTFPQQGFVCQQYLQSYSASGLVLLDSFPPDPSEKKRRPRVSSLSWDMVLFRGLYEYYLQHFGSLTL